MLRIAFGAYFYMYLKNIQIPHVSMARKKLFAKHPKFTPNAM